MHRLILMIHTLCNITRKNNLFLLFLKGVTMYLLAYLQTVSDIQ